MIGYPGIEAFRDNRIPTLRSNGYDIDMAYESGRPPVLEMFTSGDDEPEVIQLSDKWSAETLEEFVTSKLSKRNAGTLDAGANDEL